MKTGKAGFGKGHEFNKITNFLVNVWTGIRPRLGKNKDAVRYVLCLLGTILEDIAGGKGRFANLDRASKARLVEQAIAEAEDMLLGLTGISVGPCFAKALAAGSRGEACHIRTF